MENVDPGDDELSVDGVFTEECIAIDDAGCTSLDKPFARADLLARRVEVGMLWVNMPAAPSAEMPFGGIKDSGYGSEGGPEAMDAYLNARSVAIMNV